jgi:hypothetical protein
MRGEVLADELNESALFSEQVIEPASLAPSEIERLRELAERFLRHVEQDVFPGGCSHCKRGRGITACVGAVERGEPHAVVDRRFISSGRPRAHARRPSARVSARSRWPLGRLRDTSGDV